MFLNPLFIQDFTNSIFKIFFTERKEDGSTIISVFFTIGLSHFNFRIERGSVAFSILFLQPELNHEWIINQFLRRLFYVVFLLFAFQRQQSSFLFCAQFVGFLPIHLLFRSPVTARREFCPFSRTFRLG